MSKDKPPGKDKPAAKGPRHGETRPDPVKEHMAENPAGTAAGAAAGAVAGTVVGMGAGPLGMAAGAVAGAAAGALRGSGARGSREVTVEREDAHWREHYAERSYTGPGAEYDDYGPAYRLAVDEWLGHDGRRSWDDARSALEAAWPARREGSSLSWKEAEPAARDAWMRLGDVARPGDGTGR